jgi:imidazole glycerol-phosphate synthase subunit HisH
MISIIDYGVGNLRSVQRAVAACGYRASIVTTHEDAAKASLLIVPGQGAAGTAMRNLRERGLDDVIRNHARTKPYMGICLGFQLLYDYSEEDGGQDCLGILPGHVAKLPDMPDIKIPQMGWNRLHVKHDPKGFFSGLSDPIYAYFANSYVVIPADSAQTCTETVYGIPFASSVQTETIFACQFHPEKSSTVGLGVLQKFLDSHRELLSAADSSVRLGHA